ncbi:hypothetical protein [Halocatena salina]|uniref:Uncharacterized protein n=1 Tax=Halocatena salina TaxID=2934340 RepID=A0A8U0A2L8_9EURY|nr:hypothetical protein [Halocatena salina]UPM43039.1 hypothetical protein MW046_00980 [Halocatena salina]
MSQYGSRNRTRSPITRIVPDLRITNYDLMEREVSVEITDEADETVVTADRTVVRGGDLTWRGVFQRPGTYNVTVSLHYGESVAATYSVRPGRTGIGLDIHPDSIEIYRVPASE